jgi:3-oxoacyl-[acyl-carrier-protein] synthase II
LLSGESGIKRVKSFEVDDLACKIAGQVPSEHVEQTSAAPFNPLNYITAKDLNRMDTFIVYALAAATEAINDSGICAAASDEEKERIGVLIGSGIGGLPAIYDTSVNLKENGARKVSPFFIPSSLINLASGHVSMAFGLKGPNHSVVTACATGTHAIGDAARIIQVGSADAIVAGGTEAAVCRIGIAGFSATRALSTCRNDFPEEASRPWDKSRDGFVMAEGSGVVVLEELNHARRRGAKIYGELIGYGMSSDAYHVTAPLPDGSGAYRSMREALRSGAVSPDQIDYINAHGTSTVPGDLGELRAVERILGVGTAASMSSTKSAIGHLLGAAGAVEAIFALLSMKDQVVPPTINLHDSEETFIDLVPLQAKERRVRHVLSNSFGFGGTNASIIFRNAVDCLNNTD